MTGFSKFICIRNKADVNEIDEEIKGLINESYKKVKSSLESKRSAIDRIAKILLEKEVLEGEALRQLIKD